MADAPKAKVTQKPDDSGGIGIDPDLVCILSCMQSGSAAVLAPYVSGEAVQTVHGYGEGGDLVHHYIERLRKKVLFGRIATNAAAAIGPVDTKGVTGTSVVTFTSAASGPYDDEDLVVRTITGGTIAVAGIVIRVSRDGGMTEGGEIRLGTSTSYTIPGAGVTVNFAAGTLVAGDKATAHCSAPRFNGAGLQACFDALKAGTNLPRIVHVCGDVIDATELQAVIDAINNYESAGGRFGSVVCSARDRRPKAKMQGTPTVSTAAAGKTYTRSAGSFITDGFFVGGKATWAGFVNAASNGDKTITVLTATVMTVTEAIGADEAAVAATTCSFEETKAQWRSAINAIPGATPETLKVSFRTTIGAGRARRRSPLNGARKARPCTWLYTIRAMAREPQFSPGDVEFWQSNPEGWQLVDVDGQLEQHDERTDGGLLSMRFMCLQSHDDISGVHVSLPLTLDNDNALLSRMPPVQVGNIIAQVMKREFTRKLNQVAVLKDDGSIREVDAVRIEKYVQARVSAIVLVEGKEGYPMVSRFGPVALTRGINLATPGAVTPVNAKYIPLGTTEQFDVNLFVSRGV